MEFQRTEGAFQGSGSHLLMCICGGSTSKSHHKNSPPLFNYALNGHPGPCPDKEVFVPFLDELCLSDKKSQ